MNNEQRTDAMIRFTTSDCKRDTKEKEKTATDIENDTCTDRLPRLLIILGRFLLFNFHLTYCIHSPRFDSVRRQSLEVAERSFRVERVNFSTQFR